MSAPRRAAPGALAPPPGLEPGALLCALVLVPGAYSRNRFYEWFAGAELARVRRRAARVRSVLRQLGAAGAQAAVLLGEQRLADGTVLLRYRVPGASLTRTLSLAPLEKAALRYALHRSRGDALDPADREVVEAALARLGLALD
ncbi:MAG: hypothetical protein IT376_10370 [Polyangiaceae bacterium]|nr:hypothetical protein [Polyangiaceae bacterium]